MAAKRKVAKKKPVAKATKKKPAAKAAKAAKKKATQRKAAPRAKAAGKAKKKPAAKRAPRAAAVVAAPGRPALPYLTCKDAPAALEFYKQGFGAVETMRMTGPDGKLGHAEITIEGARVMLSDEHPDFGAVSPETLGGTPVGIVVQVADVDEMFARALAAGAESMQVPRDQPWGDRMCTLRDPFGHRWSFMTPKEEVTKEELGRRMEGEYQVS